MKGSSVPYRHRLLISLCLLLCCCGLWTSQAYSGLITTDADRHVRVLGSLLYANLQQHHLRSALPPEELTERLLPLFLESIDGRKRFLLQSDTKDLRQYTHNLKQQIRSSRIELVEEAYAHYQQRLSQLRPWINQRLQKPFDWQRQESLQTDTDKLHYCNSMAALKDRWRQQLKYQLGLNYLEQHNSSHTAENPDAEADTTGDSRKQQLAQQRQDMKQRYQHLLQRLQDQEKRDFYHAFYNALARSYDPHTTYMPPQQQEDFAIHLKGSLEGIGAVLREDKGRIEVVRVIPGGGAAQQGDLEAGDTILQVGQGSKEPKDITDMPLRDAVELIRGPKGSIVTLYISKPAGKRQKIKIQRDVVELEQTFARSTILPEKSGAAHWGYLRIPTFYRDFGNNSAEKQRHNNVTTDVKRQLQQLTNKGCDGLILDLRHNGGGSLQDAVAVSGLFLPQGPIVQTHDQQGRREVLQDPDKNIHYKGPLIVLVDSQTASAGEIVAAALQDYNRALILGAPQTHGKGTVQGMVNLDRILPEKQAFQSLDPLGGLKITLQQFYRITGESTQKRGVTPDIQLPDPTINQATLEKKLPHALPFDRIEAADFTPWSSGLSPQNRSLLQKRSNQAQQNSKSLLQQQTQYQKRLHQAMNNTRHSLMLDDMAQRQKRLEKVSEQAKAFPAGFRLRPTDNQQKDASAQGPQWPSGLRQDPWIRHALELLRQWPQNTQTAQVQEKP